MLLKSKITKIEILSDDWKQDRKGRFTSSNMFLIMGERGLGEQGMNYIRSRVYEYLTGQSTEQEFDNDFIRHGNMYENEGIQAFLKLKGVEFVVIQKMIHEEGTLFSSTPDFLWVKAETSDKLSYEVATGEIKAFQGASYIKVAECETPAHLKSADNKSYWQCLHQMDECGALEGYFVVYNPFFKTNGGFRVIEFRKINLIPEFKLLNERKALALEHFERIKTKLENIKN
jgi:hypothetical protein